MVPPQARLHPLLTPTLQVAGAVSSLFILLIILKLGELFRDLPKVSLHPSQPGFMALARPGRRLVSLVPFKGLGDIRLSSWG